jgi:hypothetical protein
MKGNLRIQKNYNTFGWTWSGYFRVGHRTAGASENFIGLGYAIYRQWDERKLVCDSKGGDSLIQWGLAVWAASIFR